MTRSITNNLQRLQSQALEISIASPQVISHRLQQFAAAGLSPDSKDIAEFNRMIAEKQLAFFQSWSAMTMQVFTVQQTLWQHAMQTAVAPWTFATPQSLGQTATRDLQRGTLQILNRGLAPVRKKAVANARRLKR